MISRCTGASQKYIGNKSSPGDILDVHCCIHYYWGDSPVVAIYLCNVRNELPLRCRQSVGFC